MNTDPRYPLAGPSDRLDRRTLLVGALGLGTAACGPASSDAPAPADTAPASSAPASSLPASSATSPSAGRASLDQIVTMLGDSITAGYGLPAAQSLPVQLETALRKLGSPVRVRAAGVSGDTTAGGLARVDFSVQDDTDLCIVALGGNDMLQGIDPATVKSNLQTIIDRLRARHIPVLLAGMKAPPQYGRYATEFDRVFVDLSRADDIAAYPFLLNGVALDRRYNQADGIHPNAEGVRIIAAALAPVVAQALARFKPPAASRAR